MMDLRIGDQAKDSNSNDNEEEKCLTFLPSISQEIAAPIFRCYLKRVAAILSTVDFTATHFPPLPPDMSQYPAKKLLSASQVLKSMYMNAANEGQRNTFLALVAEETAFLRLVIQQSCRIMVLENGSSLLSDPYNIQSCTWLLNFWRGPTLYFLGLITWALEMFDSMKLQMEKYGLLIIIIDHLKRLPLNAIHGLVEEKVLAGLIWFSMRIIFQCGAETKHIQLLYDQHDCIDAIQALLEASIIEIRLVTRGLILSLPSAGDREKEVRVLSIEEISELVAVLNFDGPPGIFSFSYHGMNCQGFVMMIKCLMKEPENSSLLIQWGIPELLGNISESLAEEEEQDLLATLVWELMQFASGTSDTTPLETAEDQNQAFCSEIPNEVIAHAEGAAELTEILLNFLCRTFLPYENISLEDGFKDLPDDTWYTAGVCIFLISKVLFESDERLTEELIYITSQKPESCKAMQLAFQISLTVDIEGLPKPVMMATLDELVKILMAWSDGNSTLAQEIARSGFVLLLTSILQTGTHLEVIPKSMLPRLTHSLFTLLNISYNTSNYPAFFFAFTINELLPYIRAPYFMVSSTAKFILSNLHGNLDCEQLLVLSLEENEADYCVKRLHEAVNSPDFKAEGFATHELLHILDNFTNLSYCKPSLGSFPSKKGKAKKPSYFDQLMLEVADKFANNCLLLTRLKILPLLEKFLTHPNKFQGQACKLLWNLLHQDKIKHELEANYPNVCHQIQDMKGVASEKDQQIIYCCLWQLEVENREDLNEKMKYASGCYKLQCYSVAATVCIDVIKQRDVEKRMLCEAKLLKGKSLFHCYQRKIMYLMEKKSVMSKEEEKRLINECFECIKEVVYLLGGALDENYIDEEGSRLLDWAMMDCIRETNQLNLCKRCFLCRRRDQVLCKSHIFPKFQLSRVEDHIIERDDLDNTQKFFVFGLDKHQLKSAGECWLWLCCKRCEGIMTQNAENDFSECFPSSGTVEYSTWLYDYCCTIIFRTLSCVKFPRSFNDDEIYEALLSCRKHLLFLPIKGNSSTAEPTEAQNELLTQVVAKDINFYLFIFPAKSKISLINQESIGLAFPWLSCNRLIDGKLNLAGQGHFFTAYCNGINIMLRFSPSAQCPLPERCRILPQGGSYSIPTDDEAVELLPNGLHMLKYRSTVKYFKDMSEVIQQIAPRAAEKMVQKGAFKTTMDIPFSSEEPDLSDYDQIKTCSGSNGVLSDRDMNTQGDSHLETTAIKTFTKPQLSMLPSNFTIMKYWPSKQIKIPQGHHIVLHTIDDSCGITLFLIMEDKNQPYAIYLYENSNYIYVDGAFISETDRELCFGAFLLNNLLCTQMRAQVEGLQDDIKTLLLCLLSKYGFLSLEMFINHYLQSIKIVKGLLSIRLKCSQERCWYCRDLCHCCMEPALLRPGNEKESSYRFCSQVCETRFCLNPSQMPQRTFAVDHKAEVLEGKFKGPSVLEIVHIHREESERYNTFEFISFCLGDGSGVLSLGELYILWQVRKVDSQVYMNFRSTEECIPLEILWCRFEEKEDVSSLLECILKKQPKLMMLLNISLKALNYKDLNSYLKSFRINSAD